jgi:hypothetical protein
MKTDPVTVQKIKTKKSKKTGNDYKVLAYSFGDSDWEESHVVSEELHEHLDKINEGDKVSLTYQITGFFKGTPSLKIVDIEITE